MRFGTRRAFKSVVAAEAASLLAWAAVANGDHAGGLVFAGERAVESRVAGGRRGAFGLIRALVENRARRAGTGRGGRDRGRPGARAPGRAARNAGRRDQRFRRAAGSGRATVREATRAQRPALRVDPRPARIHTPAAGPLPGRRRPAHRRPRHALGRGLTRHHAPFRGDRDADHLRLPACRRGAGADRLRRRRAGRTPRNAGRAGPPAETSPCLLRVILPRSPR